MKENYEKQGQTFKCKNEAVQQYNKKNNYFYIRRHQTLKLYEKAGKIFCG